MQETTATDGTAPAEPAQPDPRALAVLPPPKRAALALKSTETEQHLRGLIAKTAEITNVVDANGRNEAHSAAMMLKNARVTVVNVGKVAREDAVAFQRAVIAESDRLAAITSDEETRLFKLRDDFDDKVAAEKAEQARKEAERKAGIIAIIDSIRRLPAEYAGYDSAVLTDLLATLAKREATEEEFAEFATEARTAIDTTASALLTLREGALAREEKARQDAEARRVEAERIAAERAALEAQRAEQERIAAEQAATLAEIKRVQADAEAARKQVEAERAEHRRIEQEAAEAERRKIEQAAADLAEQRAAFAREQESAAQRQRDADQAEANRLAAAEQAIADAKQQATEAREELVDRIDVNAPIEAIVQVLDIVSEDKPSDEEMILLMCATFDMLLFEAIERLAAFNVEAARERHPLPV